MQTTGRCAKKKTHIKAMAFGFISSIQMCLKLLTQITYLLLLVVARSRRLVDVLCIVTREPQKTGSDSEGRVRNHSGDALDMLNMVVLETCSDSPDAQSRTYSMFVAPWTTPTTLYLLEKNVIQSFKVPLSLSSRSCHSAFTSSGLVEVFPRALEASFPANTGFLLAGVTSISGFFTECQYTHRCKSRQADKPCCLLRHKLYPVFGKSVREVNLCDAAATPGAPML